MATAKTMMVTAEIMTVTATHERQQKQ